MSSEFSIIVNNLAKCFQIYDKPRDRLLQMLAFGKQKYYREFWALRDISFSIGKGETVGIIGRNGSGKSTLLQVICGTLNPTSGDVQVHGRVAALLELGSGFNPEFSGRENVYLNAAVLGLSREETTMRFKEIEDFADIGDFIDQPVKIYSSGMMMRLAFAVAIHAEPEILVVDEALSVGDELFQRKCFSRIEAIKEAGATIFFVSHSAAQIVELCDKAFLLESGELLAMGAPKRIVGFYQKLLYASPEKIDVIKREIRDGVDGSKSEAKVELTSADVCGALNALREMESYFDPGLMPQSTLEYVSHGATIELPCILDLKGRQVNCLRRRERYRYCYKVNFHVDACNVRYGMLIKTTTGFELGGALTKYEDICDEVQFVKARSQIEICYEFTCNLNPGTYFLNAGVLGEVNGVEQYLHRILDVCVLKVLPDSDKLPTAVVDFHCSPNIRLCD